MGGWERLGNAVTSITQVMLESRKKRIGVQGANPFARGFEDAKRLVEGT